MLFFTDEETFASNEETLSEDTFNQVIVIMILR